MMNHFSHVLIEYSYSKFDSVEGTESRPPLPIPNRSQSTRIWNFNHGPFTLDMYLVSSLARCCYAGQCRLKRKFRCFLLPDTTLGYTESLDRMLAVIAEGFKPLFTISAKSPQPVQTMRWGCGGLKYNIPTLSSTSDCRAWTFSTMTSHALPAFQSSALTQPEGPSPQSYTGSWWSSWHITGASKVRFQKVRCLPTPIW